MTIDRTLALPYHYQIQPAVLCRTCGADLTGKLRRDTLDGPECLAGCRPRVFQLALPDDLRKTDQAAKSAANTAGCLANGMLPD